MKTHSYENATRHDKRIGSWIDKRDARNPLLKERVSALNSEFDNLCRIRDQAWGGVDGDRVAWLSFTTDEIVPVREKLHAVRHAFFCDHTHTDYGDDCLVCLDCGAQDYGLGWDYFFYGYSNSVY